MNELKDMLKRFYKTFEINVKQVIILIDSVEEFVTFKNNIEHMKIYDDIQSFELYSNTDSYTSLMTINMKDGVENE